MKQFKVELLKLTELDKYETGCEGPTHDHGVVFSFQSSDLSLVIDRVTNYTNFDLKQAEPVDGEPNRAEFCCLELDDGTPLNDHQVLLWQHNKIKAYNSMYSLYLTEVTTVDGDVTQLIKGGVQ